MVAPVSKSSHKGDYLDYTPGSAVLAGAVVKIVDSVTVGYIGCADNDIAANAYGQLAVVGVRQFPLKNADTPTLGQLAYWDSTNGYMTVTSTSNCLAGRFEGMDSALLCRVAINVR